MRLLSDVIDVNRVRYALIAKAYGMVFSLIDGGDCNGCLLKLRRPVDDALRRVN